MLSVQRLDLVPVPADLARSCCTEQPGFSCSLNRPLITGFACGTTQPRVIGYSPALTIALAGSVTSRIRLGSGVLPGTGLLYRWLKSQLLKQRFLAVSIGVGRAGLRKPFSQPRSCYEQYAQDRYTDEVILLAQPHLPVSWFTTLCCPTQIVESARRPAWSLRSVRG